MDAYAVPLYFIPPINRDWTVALRPRGRVLVWSFVPACEGLEPPFGCFWLDVAEAVRNDEMECLSS